MQKSGFKIAFFLIFRIMVINSEMTGVNLQEQMVKLYDQMSIQNGQMTTLIENQNNLIRSLSDQLLNRNGKIDELENAVDQCNGKMMRFENSMSNEMEELKSGMENAMESLIEVQDDVSAMNKPVVQFFAERNDGGHVYEGDTITFTKTNLNNGDGFSKSSGTFVAPFSGVYKFEFAAMTMRDQYSAEIYILKNNAQHSRIYEWNGEKQVKANEHIAHIWSMVLNRGDSVKLKMNFNGLYVSNGHHHVWFSGELLKEL